MTADLLDLRDWLPPGVTHVAMESTGVYWKPVYNLLEERVHLAARQRRAHSRCPGARPT